MSQNFKFCGNIQITIKLNALFNCTPYLIFKLFLLTLPVFFSYGIEKKNSNVLLFRAIIVQHPFQLFRKCIITIIEKFLKDV